MLYLNKFIDATVLGPNVSSDKVTSIAEDAQTHNYASICIPPYFVEEIRHSYSDIIISTVIGFPHGISCREAKATEIQKALDAGAQELDIVVSLTAIANDNLGFLEKEMESLLAVKQNSIYKLILESGLWTDTQLANIVKFYSQYNIEYLKTSTGFNGSGATQQAVKIMLDNKSDDIKIKASGGIRDYDQACRYVDMGVNRIGTSSPSNLLQPNT